MGDLYGMWIIPQKACFKMHYRNSSKYSGSIQRPSFHLQMQIFLALKTAYPQGRVSQHITEWNIEYLKTIRFALITAKMNLALVSSDIAPLPASFSSWEWEHLVICIGVYFSGKQITDCKNIFGEWVQPAQDAGEQLKHRRGRFNTSPVPDQLYL